MTVSTVALFEGEPNLFERRDPEYLLSPALDLRAGGRRSENAHFWLAVDDVFCGMDDPASEIIEKRCIVDKQQQDEIRRCAALIKLRRGEPLDQVLLHHEIDKGPVEDVLRLEDENLRELRSQSQVFRAGLVGVYTADNVYDVIKTCGVKEAWQQEELKAHAFKFYLRRTMTPEEIVKIYKINDEGMKRSLFREAVRLEIEKGHAAPDAIEAKGMTNEEDKVFMRVISALEDISEGMLLEAAVRRNGVSDSHRGDLEAFQDRFDTEKYQGEILDGLLEEHLHALETTPPYGKGLKRKREIGDVGQRPSVKRLRTVAHAPKIFGSRFNPTSVDHVLDDGNRLVLETSLPCVPDRYAPSEINGNSEVAVDARVGKWPLVAKGLINPLGSSLNPIVVDYALNDRDELVREQVVSFPKVCVAGTHARISLTKDGTKERTVDLTGTSCRRSEITNRPSGRPPPVGRG